MDLHMSDYISYSDSWSFLVLPQNPLIKLLLHGCINSIWHHRNLTYHWIDFCNTLLGPSVKQVNEDKYDKWLNKINQYIKVKVIKLYFQSQKTTAILPLSFHRLIFSKQLKLSNLAHKHMEFQKYIPQKWSLPQTKVPSKFFVTSKRSLKWAHKPLTFLLNQFFQEAHIKQAQPSLPKSDPMNNHE